MLKTYSSTSIGEMSLDAEEEHRGLKVEPNTYKELKRNFFKANALGARSFQSGRDER